LNLIEFRLGEGLVLGPELVSRIRAREALAPVAELVPQTRHRVGLAPDGTGAVHNAGQLLGVDDSACSPATVV
jgi:hypothetical protein